ncbi:bpX5 domain-containing protein [Corallococcus sp. M7]
MRPPSEPAVAGLPVRWRPRALPLEPVAVAGVGPVALALGHRASRAEDSVLASWNGVAGPDVLVLLGTAASLPWVDGAVYLGRDPLAPALLLPCSLEPEVAPSLLERALLAGQGDAPLAVLPASGMLVSVAAAKPVARVSLSAWLSSMAVEATS